MSGGRRHFVSSREKLVQTTQLDGQKVSNESFRVEKKHELREQQFSVRAAHEVPRDANRFGATNLMHSTPINNMLRALLSSGQTTGTIMQPQQAPRPMRRLSDDGLIARLLAQKQLQMRLRMQQGQNGSSPLLHPELFMLHSQGR